MSSVGVMRLLSLACFGLAVADWRWRREDGDDPQHPKCIHEEHTCPDGGWNLESNECGLRARGFLSPSLYTQPEKTSQEGFFERTIRAPARVREDRDDPRHPKWMGSDRSVAVLNLCIALREEGDSVSQCHS